MSDSITLKLSPSSYAIVMGGSIAGLLAARVLTDHFDHVTIVERDRFPESDQSRKGVPQGRHVHVLLAKGQEIISQLFPDIVPALHEKGAIAFDPAADMRWHHFGGFKDRRASGIAALSMSRPLLESEIRRRVLSLKNLTLIEGCDVEAPVASDDRARITGIGIHHRSGRTRETLQADLIVDATGRGAVSLGWLEELGYGRPQESIIKVEVGYTSRTYRRNPGDLTGAKVVYALPTPPRERRMGGLFPIEGDRWLITLGGWLGDHAPADAQGFLQFARSLPDPTIYSFLTRAEPLTDFVVHKFPSNLRRHYEKMERWPEGYLVVGDAMCSFNPIYGQGMTVSALDALTLDACLKERAGARGLARRFLREAAKVIDVPWSLVAGEDFRYCEVEGTRPAGTRLINWYVGKVHRAATHNPAVNRAFLNVMNMLEPPTALFKPNIVLNVFSESLAAQPATEQSDASSELKPMNR
jgi:2-polyprenyl-6-methoxyphenol hydroxylase-like FAD-dependent oxidoreductase